MTSKNDPNTEGLVSVPGPRKSTDPPASPWLAPSAEVQKEVEFKQEWQNERMTKEQVEDEVLEAVNEAKAEIVHPIVEPIVEPIVQPVVEDQKEILRRHKVLVNALRKNDDVHNRTCGKCMKRLPLDRFRRHNRSEVCEDCED